MSYHDDREPEEIYHACPYRRICAMQYDRHTDYEECVWEWAGCEDCERGDDGETCPMALSGIMRCEGARWART